jgi:uroporphyrinogen-III synthase
MKDKRIVVTRAPHQAGEFTILLKQRGAIPLLYPCIDIQLPHDTSVIDAALEEAAAGEFDWLIVTSPNVVHVLHQRCQALGIYQIHIENVAVIGSSTAKMVTEKLGLAVTVMPDTFDGKSLVDTFPSLAKKYVFMPMSDLALPTLWERLSEQKADVMAMTAYHNVIGKGGVDMPKLLAQNAIDAVTFTSPSTVENCLIRLGDTRHYLNDICVACIGPSTAKAAQANNIAVSLMPDDHTIEGLITELEHFFA